MIYKGPLLGETSKAVGEAGQGQSRSGNQARDDTMQSSAEGGFSLVPQRCSGV